MSDITNVFKATIKTVRAREKALGSTNSGSDKYIFPSSHRIRSEFTSHAQQLECEEWNDHVTVCDYRLYTYNVKLVEPVSKLVDFEKMYKRFINGENSKLTDRDRDRIDADSKLFIKKCSEAVHKLKSEAHSCKVLPQVKEHKDVVVQLIEHFLKDVCQLYSEQQAIRVKRAVDRKRLARLAPVGSSLVDYPKPPSYDDSSPDDKSKSTGVMQPHLLSANLAKDLSDPSSTKISKDTPDPSSAGTVKDTPGLQLAESSKVASPSSSSVKTSKDLPDDEPDISLSEEEKKLLQLENQMLYNEMSSMVDEVRQIETKIVEIAKLQKLFAEKVFEQDKDVMKVAETVVGSTENIKEGNEQIRQAMKNNAVFRIWILFFLIVCALSLLFLDWYNA